MLCGGSFRVEFVPMNNYSLFPGNSAWSRHWPGLAVLTTLLLMSVSWRTVAAPLTVALCPENADLTTALFSQLFYAADGQPRQLLVLGGQPALPDCEIKVVEAGAASVSWAAMLPADLGASHLRYLALQGKFSPAPVTISEIIGSNDSEQVAAPNPSGLNLPTKPVALAPGRPLGFASNNPDRTAWLWSPALWQDTPELIWQLQTHQHLAAIYVTVPVSGEGEVENPEALAMFISAASQRNLKVWAVIGDHRDVLAESRAALQTRLEAYLLYNQSAAPQERLQGVQLDIEPYLLPGFGLAQQHWRDRYLAVVAFTQQLLGKALALDLVMPLWWSTHPDWSAQLFDKLALPGLSITVMNYQTDPALLLHAAEPFLAFGQRAGIPVRMALESGRLPDETRRYYAGNVKTGELWLLDVQHNPVLLLLAAPVAGLPGQLFSFTEQKPVSASTTTFAGDLLRLGAVADEVASQWSGWSSFAGIALHGLEETLTAEPQ